MSVLYFQARALEVPDDGLEAGFSDADGLLVCTGSCPVGIAADEVYLVLVPVCNQIIPAYILYASW